MWSTIAIAICNNIYVRSCEFTWSGVEDSAPIKGTPSHKYFCLRVQKCTSVFPYLFCCCDNLCVNRHSPRCRIRRRWHCSNLHWPLRQWAAQTGWCGYSGDIREPTWCNGSTLAHNARDVGSIPDLGILFLHNHVTDCHDHDPVQAMRCMVGC